MFAIFESQARLDAAGQCAKVGDSLQLVVGELNMKMVLEARQQVEGLQAIDPKRLEEVVIRREFLARHLEVLGGEVEDLVERLF